MNLDDAMRLTEILLALAFIQQSLEHLHSTKDSQALFLPRLLLSVALLLGWQTSWILLGLVILGLLILKKFQGPYNGGSDRMSLLILCCLCLASFMPETRWREYALGYLALQVMLSYFIAGWVKIVNPEWRDGRALQDVFVFSAYPVSESLRSWAKKPLMLLIAAWAVMLFELLFPLILFSKITLVTGLILAACFHLANACLFGLNRFFWIWLAAYPSLFWLHQRIFQ